MGYTTDFDGQFKLDHALTPEHLEYLQAFSETRRMKRAAVLSVTRQDPLREAVGLPIGEDGAYFVGTDRMEWNAADILNHNEPPAGQPGVWCKWIPTEDGLAIEWDRAEKFYDYVEWLAYLVEHFLKPWGYTLNGEVSWQGEDTDDFGILVVSDNRVGIRQGVQTYGPTQWGAA